MVKGLVVMTSWVAVPALTVSLWVPLVSELADTVTSGEPATVSP
jgi:hypothetical protein